MSLERLLLQREIEDWLYSEAELLDARRFEEWLALLDDGFRVFVPMTRNVRYDQTDAEKTREKQDTNWFDEGKETISQRIAQIATGLHWAEEPRSRTVHMITNVRLAEVTEESVTAGSAFMLYRSRGHDETDYLVGRRRDVLRRADGGWRLLRREVDLSQTVLLAKNLTTFF